MVPLVVLGRCGPANRVAEPPQFAPACAFELCPTTLERRLKAAFPSARLFARRPSKDEIPLTWLESLDGANHLEPSYLSLPDLIDFERRQMHHDMVTNRARRLGISYGADEYGIGYPKDVSGVLEDDTLSMHALRDDHKRHQ